MCACVAGVSHSGQLAVDALSHSIVPLARLVVGHPVIKVVYKSPSGEDRTALFGMCERYH